MKLSTINEWPLFGRRKAPLYTQSEYHAAFQALLKKHGGNKDAAVAEFNNLVRTPVGQYQLKRHGMDISQQADEPSLDQLTFQAANTSGPDMFKSR